jgi:predicted RND superfamily exporter protein
MAASIGNWLFGPDRSIGFGLENLGFLTLARPRIVAVIVVALTMFCLAQLPRAAVDGDLLRVYAHSGPEYDAYRELADTFGTFENDIYLLVRSPTLTNPNTIEAIREMALSVTLSDYLSGSMSAFTLRKPGSDGGTLPVVPEGMRSPEEVEAALTDLQQNDPLMRNLINPDLSGVVIILFPNQQITSEQGTKPMIDDLRSTLELFASEDIQVELTGPPIWTAEMLGATVDDQIKFTIYGFSLGALVAFLSLRSFWGALLVSATPFVAVFWVMGLVLALFGSFTFLTVIVTTIILVITFAESLFFIFNWLAFWRDGEDPRAAINKTIRVIGPATALTMLTTLVAFASLSLTPGQGLPHQLRVHDDLPAAAAEGSDPARAEITETAQSCGAGADSIRVVPGVAVWPSPGVGSDRRHHRDVRPLRPDRTAVLDRRLHDARLPGAGGRGEHRQRSGRRGADLYQRAAQGGHPQHRGSGL